MPSSNIVHKIESLFPKRIVEGYRKIKWWVLFRKSQYCYNRIARGIRKKGAPYNVLFFALDSNTWKYDSLFQAMQNDPDFSPMVLAVPQVNRGRDFMQFQLKHGMEYYKSKGYKAVCSYDEKTDSYVDAFSFHPDIIFFSNPYDGLVDDRYNIRNFIGKALTCYVNYGFCSVPDQWSCASQFHQRVWRYYVECEENLKQVKSYYSGDNCVVTGYPTADLFASTTATGKDWKLKDEKLKRVIWAPHHTIEGQTGLIQFSTFLLYYDFMLKLAEDYQETAQFVFKPHPLLKPALYDHPNWGKEKTDAYYEKWANGKNTTYVSGDYVDLFKSSDAMIHDCGSFTIEYLYVQKPVMFLGNFDRLSQSNEVGKQAYACHYQGKKGKDIIDFLNNIVLEGKDVLKSDRDSFFEKILNPNGDVSVAERIMCDIKEAINNK